jgi:uncharacterized protein
MSINDDHWSFMDGYGELLVARTFAYKEPYYRAGVVGSVLLCPFHTVLGRTMWDCTEAVDGYGRFLVITMDESDPAPSRRNT